MSTGHPRSHALRCIFRRVRVLALGMSASAMLYGNAYAADELSRDVEFNIAAQTLERALEEWGAQAHIQIMLASGPATERKSPEIKGRFTARVALNQLLNGSGLAYHEVGDHTVTIEPASASEVADQKSFRVASAQATNPEDQSVTTEKDRTAGRTHERPSESKETERPRLEEIVVTGSHIRGLSTVPSPTLTFTRDDIDSTGAGSLEGFLATIPQNLNDITPTSTFSEAGHLAAYNQQFASGVSLHGLGADSTLVLLNGVRRPGQVQGRVFDLSSIPLSVVDRVDIVTGGDSAIYGSDAVAGVVNIITRRDLDGFESKAYYGARSGSGGERLQLDQAFGQRSDRGGFLLAYDFERDWALDATRANAVNPQATLLPIPGMYDLLPDTRRQSGFLTGHFTVTDQVEVQGDAVYTHFARHQLFGYTYGSALTYQSVNDWSQDEYSVAPGLRVHLTDQWDASLNGVYGRVRNSDVTLDNIAGFEPGQQSDTATLSVATATLDGDLFGWGKTAVGVEAQWERYTWPFVLIDGSRTVQAVFGELSGPVIGAGGEGGTGRVDLSLAGRYSHYSDFGGTFNPQVGISWVPQRSITLRATYSTAFRAPDLFTLNGGAFNNGLILNTLVDPSSPTGSAPVAFETGNNSSLRPEKAHTWTAGLELRPYFLPDSKLSISFYDIRYFNRIDQPLTTDSTEYYQALVNASRYPGFLNRSPTAAQLQAAIDAAAAGQGIGNFTGTPFDPATQTLLGVFPNISLFDDRLNNIARERARGMDALFAGDVPEQIGTFSYAMNATYYFTLNKQIFAGAAAVSQLNTPGEAVDFRMRLQGGFSRAAIKAFVFFNYVKPYKDPLAAPTSDIASWTTADCTLQVDGSRLVGQGFAKGLSGALSIQNLTNKRPPLFSGGIHGLNYDPVNANPIGRMVSLSMTAKW